MTIRIIGSQIMIVQFHSLDCDLLGIKCWNHARFEKQRFEYINGLRIYHLQLEETMMTYQFNVRSSNKKLTVAMRK